MAVVHLPVAVRPARGPAGRARGLLGRDSLDPGEGVWISPCRQVHTCGMRFPIDVAFLDGDGTVVCTVHTMSPWRVTRWVRRASGALELAAGVLGTHAVRVGDVVEWER